MSEIETSEMSKDDEALQDQLDHVQEDSYLSRDESSTERFKIELKNLPKFFGFAQLKKYLASLKLNFVKISSPNKSSYAFVTFQNEESKQEAIETLNKSTFKGRQLIAIHANPAPDPRHVEKRKNHYKNDDSIEKKTKSDNNNVDDLSLDEKVQNSTTPLWKMSYDEQIHKKTDEIEQFLRKLRRKMEDTNPHLLKWVHQQRKLYSSMACEFVDFISSPIENGYRNKCEFSIGLDRNESKSMIGFRLGDYKSGSNEVVSPESCLNISNEMKTLVKYFQKYIDEVSTYKAFNVRTHDGHWRQLMLRSNQKNDIMSLIVFDKKNLNDDEINAEKSKLTEYFETRKEEFKNFQLVTLLFSLNLKTAGTPKMDNFEKLFGEEYIYEEMLGLKFRISPLAFFQANTKAAEILYNKIIDISNIDENTIVLDICCGTGTIGLGLARRAKHVIGVDIVAEAIDDAKINSELNQIKNVEWLCGKAEDVLPKIIRRFENEKIIAIVDPPRAGLHSKVVQTLRRLNNLHKLIYVSCNPELAFGNFIDFARNTSRTYENEPFVPLKALCVDLFPHTTHYELLLYMERYKEDLLKNQTNETINSN